MLSADRSVSGPLFSPPGAGKRRRNTRIRTFIRCAIIGQNSPPGGNNGKQNRHPWLTYLACGQLYKGKISGLYSCRPTCGY